MGAKNGHSSAIDGKAAPDRYFSAKRLKPKKSRLVSATLWDSFEFGAGLLDPLLLLLAVLNQERCKLCRSVAHGFESDIVDVFLEKFRICQNSLHVGRDLVSY